MGITPDYQRRATDKYLSKMARIVLVVTPFEKECIQKAAANAEQSMTAYIIDAVDNRIQTDQDGQEIPPELISRLIQWLKDNGHSDTDVVQLLKYISTTEDI